MYRLGSRQARIANERFQFRFSHRFPTMNVRDIGIALRRLQKMPTTSILVIATLAVGIGANAMMVGAIDRLLFRAPPKIERTDRLARLFVERRSSKGDRLIAGLSNYPRFLSIAHQSTRLESAAAYARVHLSTGLGANASVVTASIVSSDFFSVLGVRPAIGRTFGKSDHFPDGETPGGTPLAVLSYGFWSRRFGSNPGAVGQSFDIDGIAYSIIGVMPDGFRGLESEMPDVWLPLTVAAGARNFPVGLDDASSAWISIVGLLRSSKERDAVADEVGRIWRRDPATSIRADSNAKVIAASVIRGREPDAPREVRFALWLAIVSTTLLFIACANVAGLLLGVALARQRENAVRSALGATRTRLAIESLTEALLLTGIAEIAAVGLASLGSRLLGSTFAADVGEASFLDAHQLLYTTGLALATAIVVSLIPIAQTARPDLAGALRGGSAERRRGTWFQHSGLLMAQAALCMTMLVGAGLFIESLRRVEGLDLGIDVEHTLVARFDFDALAIPTPEIDLAYENMLSRVRSVPGVQRVTLAYGNPYGGGRAVAAHTLSKSQDVFWHDGVSEVPLLGAVGPGYFGTVANGTLRGRDFEVTDGPSAPRVAIINEPLAKLLWPREEALGQCILLPPRFSDQGRDCVTVIGVLRGFWKRSILNREVLAVYVPLAQGTSIYHLGRPDALYIRVQESSSLVSEHIRSVIQSVRPDLPASSIQSIKSLVEPEVRPWRLVASSLIAFAGAGVIISLAGLYGVVSYSATQRKQETAVRIALGANARRIIWSVAGQGVRAVFVGLLVGAAVVMLSSPWIGPLLFQTSATDGRVFVGSAAALLLVACLAIAVPVRRSLRTNPASALRST